MYDIVERLKAESASIVTESASGSYVGHARGVRDLYDLLLNNPQLLREASVADKVVGKGAAALMILGGVKTLYALTISRPALDFLNQYGIEIRYDKVVPNIINRNADGICPVEQLCLPLATPHDCFEAIKIFLNSSL